MADAKTKRAILGPLIVTAIGLAALAVWLRHDRPAVDESATPIASIEPASSSPVRLDLESRPADTATSTSEPSARARDRVSVDVPAGSETKERALVHVVDANGVRIAGALVQLVDRRAWAGDSIAGSESTAVRATTDDNGDCALDVAHDERSLRLEASAPGFFHVRNLFAREERTTVVLARARNLVGTVVEAGTRVPVAGARVWLAHGACSVCQRDFVEADASGRFGLVTPVGIPSTLSIEADGFAMQNVRFELSDGVGDASREFAIERGVIVDGIVVDAESGAAISGARVYDTSGEARHVDADAGGRFEMRVAKGADTGTVELGVMAADHCSLLARVPITGARTSARFPLTRGTWIEGFVRDADGKPVAGAMLTIAADPAASARALEPPNDVLPAGWRWYPEERSPYVPSETSGAFRTRRLPPLDVGWSIEFGSQQFGRVRRTIERLAAAGEVTHVDVLVADKPRGNVTGTLRLNGKPIAGRVAWRNGDDAGWIPAAHNGRYFLSAIVAGTARLSGYPDLGDEENPGGSYFSAQAVDVVVVAGETTARDVDVRLLTSPIRGTVRWSDGAPASGVSIGCDAELDGRSVQLNHKTELDGSWELRVPDGATACRITARTELDSVTKTNVPPGSVGVDFVLARSRSVRVRAVERGTRMPIARIDLAWRAASSGKFRIVYLDRAVPSEDGWFTLDLPCGAIELLLRAAEASFVPSRATMDVVAGRANDIEVELVRGARATLRMADSQTALPEGPTLYLLESSIADDLEKRGPSVLSEHFPGLWSFDRALFRQGSLQTVVRGLSPGRYRLTAYPSRIDVSPAEIEINDVDIGPIAVSWTVGK